MKPRISLAEVRRRLSVVGYRQAISGLPKSDSSHYYRRDLKRVVNDPQFLDLYEEDPVVIDGKLTPHATFVGDVFAGVILPEDERIVILSCRGHPAYTWSADGWENHWNNHTNIPVTSFLDMALLLTIQKP